MKAFKLSLSTIAVATTLSLSAQADDIYTYTENESGGLNIALGYTVPIPVDSLTPIDGFRTYNSLKARHQQLTNDSDLITGQIIGQTLEGEDIWMYSVSDNDSDTRSGALEAATLINGGIHAREWQTPEAVTGFIERLYDNHNNQYLEQYLIENLNMHFIPVLNIDGFKQTQSYPNQVSVFASAPGSPRDGRMRRKNRRDVDADLLTTEDNLFGVDLNRNNEPFWAMTTASSSSPGSIVYHGTAPASEPEIQALYKAADLSPSDRLRLYLDVHSFTQIYFTPMTGNSRRDSITQNVMNTMRAANNFKYDYGPSAIDNGIGTTADHFAYNFEIPSATLETEPTQNGAADYGGNGVSHDGFILPNAEVRRMVKETSLATFSGFYSQAEKAILQQVVIRNPDGEVVVDGSWHRASDGRQLVFAQNQALAQNTNYQVSLVFNKPMRWVGDSGQVSHFPSMITTIEPWAQWLGEDNSGNAVSIEIDTSQGNWQLQQATAQEAGFKHYKTDTFTFTTDFGSAIDWSNLKRIALAVDVKDMTNQNLDANPATVVDWSGGSWTNYENSVGEQKDSGGLDKSFRLIDDGSALFPQTDNSGGNNGNSGGETPTPPSEPVLSGGGGSFGWFAALLLLAGIRRAGNNRPM